jgi:hypothetical protein
VFRVLAPDCDAALGGNFPLFINYEQTKAPRLLALHSGRPRRFGRVS